MLKYTLSKWSTYQQLCCFFVTLRSLKRCTDLPANDGAACATAIFPTIFIMPPSGLSPWGCFNSPAWLIVPTCRDGFNFFFYLFSATLFSFRKCLIWELIITQTVMQRRRYNSQNCPTQQWVLSYVAKLHASQLTTVFTVVHWFWCVTQPANLRAPGSAAAGQLLATTPLSVRVFYQPVGTVPCRIHLVLPLTRPIKHGQAGAISVNYSTT